MLFVSCLGAFSWIAVNYLVGRLSPESHAQQLQLGGSLEGSHGNRYLDDSSGNNELQTIHTVGSLDMGGASMQMAFEVDPDVSCSVHLSCLPRLISLSPVSLV